MKIVVNSYSSSSIISIMNEIESLVIKEAIKKIVNLKYSVTLKKEGEQYILLYSYLIIE